MHICFSPTAFTVPVPVIERSCFVPFTPARVARGRNTAVRRVIITKKFVIGLFLLFIELLITSKISI
jgi:hypothetical protein